MINYSEGLYFGFSITPETYVNVATANESLGSDVLSVFEDNLEYFIASETLTDSIFVGIPIYDLEDCEDIILSISDINDKMNTETFKKRAADFTEFCQKYVYPHTKQYCLPSVHLIKISW